MRKCDLDAAVDAAKAEVKSVLQLVINALNQGQQKKIVKNKEVKEVLDRYGVQYEE